MTSSSSTNVTGDKKSGKAAAATENAAANEDSAKTAPTTISSSNATENSTVNNNSKNKEKSKVGAPNADNDNKLTTSKNANKKSGAGRRSSASGGSSVPRTPADKKRGSMAAGDGSLKEGATSPAPTTTTTTTTTPAMDTHPYPRGSVIEVLYIPATAVGKTTATIQAASSSADPWYWSEDSSLCSTTSNSSTGDATINTNEDETMTLDGDDGAMNESNASITNDNYNDNNADDNKDNAENDKDVDMKDVTQDDKNTTTTTKAKKKKEKATKKQDKNNDKINNNHHHHHHHHYHQNAASVRLCDIIDRVPVNIDDGPGPGTTTVASGPSTAQSSSAAQAAQLQQQGGWRYYVHYRDFNRRMDEWIGMDRIVSPPSVGNAKARALKKEEERLKRKQQRLEEKQRAELQKKEHKILGDLDVTAPRSSRRRSSVQQLQQFGATTTTATTTTTGAAAATNPANPSLSPAAGAGAGGTAGGGGDYGPGGGGRATRWQRRKSTHNSSEHSNDDAATVVASNQGDNNETQNNNNTDQYEPAAVKEILTLPTGTATAMATTTIGEHVVATIPAQELDEHEGLDEASLREHEEITKIKNVSFIELGRHQMETWYFSPIPKELLSSRGYIEVLYICEFTFRMFARKCELKRFQQRSLKPQDRHPPGNEIYRKDNLSMFEVDGLTEKIYCQNLCYIAKLFLDHKTLYYDCDPFLFYVLCEVDDRGYHPVGYYSKEKYSDVGYNLACILTFPAHQRKGYGRFLIAFSYELSKKQETVGGPERPVSDLGQKAYKPYWAATVIDFLRNTGIERDADGNIMSSSLSIMDISKKTSIMSEDIVFTLNQLGILKIINGVYFIAAEESLLEKLAKKYPVKEPRVDPSRLHWTPFITDVKRDKFSIHSKKPNVESVDPVVLQPVTPAEQQQQQQQQQG